MTYRPSTIERAYELARSGLCGDLHEIKRRLQAEGYASIHSHFSASLLCRDLSALCRRAKNQPGALAPGAADGTPPADQ